MFAERDKLESTAEFQAIARVPQLCRALLAGKPEEKVAASFIGPSEAPFPKAVMQDDLQCTLVYN